MCMSPDRQTGADCSRNWIKSLRQTSGLGPGSGIVCGPGAAERVSMETGGSDLPPN